MNKRMYTLGTLGLAALLCAALFLTSERVQRAEKEYRHLMDQIADTKDSLRVLNAEWAYLNRPDRLEELATSYLNKPEVRKTRLVAAPALVDAPEPTVQPATYNTSVALPAVTPKKHAAKTAPKNAVKTAAKAPVKSPKVTPAPDNFYQMMKAKGAQVPGTRTASQAPGTVAR